MTTSCDLVALWPWDCPVPLTGPTVRSLPELRRRLYHNNRAFLLVHDPAALMCRPLAPRKEDTP